MTLKMLVFIRPGETDWNRSERWQGWVAVPLNERGREQAHRLASFVRTLGISALYTSDLRRAEQTAQIIGEALGLQPKSDERLRERNIGAWQGLTHAEVVSWYEDQYLRLREDPEGYVIPGGESRAQVAERVRAFFAELMAQDVGEVVCVVSHTLAIHTILSDLVAGYDMYKYSLPNISVTTIRRADENSPWQLTMIGDVTHLEGIPSLVSIDDAVRERSHGV
ncbi:MAG: histidine phosphatase family protein [Anaerolineae bacterium]|nr:histidine phosphatase family protein [Anaerolineae bacterium]MDW8173110.1 histidine phosphatase family protein [Anaerolineae bacterium]